MLVAEIVATPWAAGVIALLLYGLRALASPHRLQRTDTAYFNYLADAFLHGQLNLRLAPPISSDLIKYGGETFLYWPPFPAIVVTPLVALVGVGVSDVLYTLVFAAVNIALIAKLLEALTNTGVARLPVERRALLVVTMALGSVILILAPVGEVWFTAQMVGICCTLLAAIAALTTSGRRAYLLTGLALAAATATRLPLLFSGVWLAFYLLQRDWDRPPRWRLQAVLAGLAPIVITIVLLGWYNAARFGNPLETGLAWHVMNPVFRNDFNRYGAFDLHYLPTNLYHQFIAHPLLPGYDWKMGGSLFWMTPVFLGALQALWIYRHLPLVWGLGFTCFLLYVPIGLLMGTGWVTFGPRYLADLTVPLIVLTALGIAHWRSWVLLLFAVVSCVTYGIGSWLWLTRIQH